MSLIHNAMLLLGPSDHQHSRKYKETPYSPLRHNDGSRLPNRFPVYKVNLGQYIPPSCSSYTHSPFEHSPQPLSPSAVLATCALTKSGMANVSGCYDRTSFSMFEYCGYYKCNTSCCSCVRTGDGNCLRAKSPSLTRKPVS